MQCLHLHLVKKMSGEGSVLDEDSTLLLKLKEAINDTSLKKQYYDSGPFECKRAVVGPVRDDDVAPVLYEQ